MKIYRRIFAYALKYKGYLALCLFFALTLITGKIGGVMQVGSFFSDAFIGKNFEKVGTQTILLLIGLVFLWASSHYLVFISSNSLAVSIMHDIRRDVYSRLIDLPISYYKKNRTGEILSRVLNDISVIEIFFMNIMVELVAQPLTFIAIVIFMIVINPTISMYFFSIGPVLGVALAGIGGLVQKLSMNVQQNISNVTSNIQETIYGIEVIKGYGVESALKSKFFESNNSHLNASKKEIKVRFLGTPSSEFLGAIGVIIILVLGAMSVKSGMATSGQIVNFLLLALVLSEPLSRSTEMVMVLRKLHPAAQRVFEIIDNKDHEDLSKPDIGEIKGRIDFEDVTFGYDKDLITLRNINLSIGQGETVAIVGPSGAGKSSLISLVPLFYQPDSGSLKIDGRNSADFNPNSIRKQIALVTQENILFSGTILENILLSRPEAKIEEVVEAAKLANAHDFISRLPHGYKTMLGDKGTRLSGGEKQRIALTRAILRRPKILILDEATSSLDAESEKLIQNAMKNILGKQTTLIVTHKLSTIANADKIAVIEDGRIIETGSHAELISQGGIYHKLFQIQVNV